jgi:RNA polymerase sigma factor (sigma-70 family)
MDPGRLWEEFGPQLRGFPARRVPPGVDADDLVQEVFLRVIRSLASLRSTERPEAWLFQIARKALRDSLRVRLRRDGRTDALEVDLPAEPDAAADRAAETELAPCLAAMVGRLAELSDGDHPHVTAGCDTRRRSPPGRHLDLRHEVQGAACVTSRARCW